MASAELKKRVRKALYAAARLSDGTMPRDADVIFREAPDGKLVALVISPAFRRLSPSQRQARVWSAAEQLSDRDQRYLTFVLADTPEGHEALTRPDPPLRRPRRRPTVRRRRGSVSG